MDNIRKILAFLKPYKWTYIVYLSLNVIISALAMTGPAISRIFFDDVLEKQNSSLILPLMIAFVAQVLVKHAIHYTRAYFLARDSYRFTNDVRSSLFKKLLSQSHMYIQAQNTGEVLTVLNNDIEFIRNCINYHVITYIEWVTLLIYAGIMLASINPWSLLICFAFTPVAYLVGRRFSSHVSVTSKNIRDTSASLGMVAQENINGSRIVRAFAAEEAEISKFDKVNMAFREANMMQVRLWQRFNIPMQILSVTPHFLSVAVGSFLVIYNHMSVGDFVAMGGYVPFVMLPLANLSNIIMQLKQFQVCAKRICDFLDIGVSIRSKEDALTLTEKKCDIRLDDVSFSVNSHVILDSVTLDLPQGKSLGVVGVTGSGKTMLCNLLCRFVDPNSGEISVNGINYRDVELASLRQSVSYVPQDIFLFSETIERNVALYAPDTPFERVQECCRIAQADDFITAMPEGYETIIGERGVGLSGGQRQRLSIARAILKDSPVMIFDDSSSALDTETEKQLLHALYTDLSHKTKVIVAHKISSVKDCDEIIVLDQGRIVERGTHEELIQLSGRYAEIYTEQLSSNSEVA